MLRRIPAALALVILTGSASRAQDTVRHINPATLPLARGYSQIVEAPPGARLVFLSGQVPLDSTGRFVGAGDFRAQATQVFENLRRALAAVGGSFRDVVKVTFFVRNANANLNVLREVRDAYISTTAAPASTLVEVTALFRPDALLEIDAIAVVAR